MASLAESGAGDEELPLPSIPYVRSYCSYIEWFVSLTAYSLQWKCRQIMTRTDFLDGQIDPLLTGRRHHGLNFIQNSTD